LSEFGANAGAWECSRGAWHDSETCLPSVRALLLLQLLLKQPAVKHALKHSVSKGAGGPVAAPAGVALGRLSAKSVPLLLAGVVGRGGSWQEE